MNTTASYENSFRRGSIESVLSLQEQETDFVRDTSDTNSEYEPVTEEDDGPFEEEHFSSDSEIISTKIIEISPLDEGDQLQFADSEEDSDSDVDSEIDYHDYWKCARCGASNNNPLFRYCEKCFKVRKNFFPPRPKRKTKDVHHFSSQRDSGVDSCFNSQEIDTDVVSPIEISDRQVGVKRRAESVDHNRKRIKLNNYYTTSSESDSGYKYFSKVNTLKQHCLNHINKQLDLTESVMVKKLVKTVSDPSVSIENDLLAKNSIVNTLKKNLINSDDNMCIVCFNEPKSGVFVHGRIAHICCCYKCAVKVWSTAKRCPICNCKVSNVLKAVM